MKEAVVPLTVDEMKRLMDVIEAEGDDFDYMLFLTLKLTGRRIGELYGIQGKKIIKRRIVGRRKVYIEGEVHYIDKTIPIYSKLNQWNYGVKVKDVIFDNDLNKCVMRVWVAKRRKWIQDESPLNPKLVGVLKRYIQRNNLRPEDYLFRKPGRSIRMLQSKIKYYSRLAKINHNVSIHNFRHYLITNLKRQGWDNEKIAKITGHKNPAVVSLYDHIVATDIRNEFEKAIEQI